VAQPSARIAFVTNAPLFERASGLFSPLASVRREIILPARALAARGIGVHVISLSQWPADQVRAILEKAGRIVFGKMLPKAQESVETAFEGNAQAYRALLHNMRDPGRCVFCFADDHFDVAPFARFYQDVAPLGGLWVASSQDLKERLREIAHGDVLVYPEMVETRRHAARTPYRRWRHRAAVWASRQAGIGLEPWRIRLLWFGHPTNAEPVINVMDELRALAREVPLRLECVTQPGSPLEALATPRAVAARSNLQVVAMPWSLEYMDAALDDCDAVILPQALRDQKKLAKSNNRMVDALHAGRFVVAHPIPSYQALGDFAWVGDSIAEGLRWLLAHPAQALRRVVAGQEHVARHHSLDALGEFWLRALEIEKAS
jgi:hypothetical protein